MADIGISSEFPALYTFAFKDGPTWGINKNFLQMFILKQLKQERTVWAGRIIFRFDFLYFFIFYFSLNKNIIDSDSNGGSTTGIYSSRERKKSFESEVPVHDHTCYYLQYFLLLFLYLDNITTLNLGARTYTTSLYSGTCFYLSICLV